MIFAPHILQVKVITPMDKDEFGRPIPGTGGESWQDVCKCRCDDVSAEKKCLSMEFYMTSSIRLSLINRQKLKLVQKFVV